MPDPIRQLSEFLAETGYTDLPEAVTAHARLVAADTVAVIAAGAAESEMRALTESMAVDGSCAANVLGSDKRAAPELAAFINATAGTFLELDEGNRFAGGHPAVHVVPAALALSEAGARTGKEFLLALVLGYEVAARVGIGTNLRPGLHPHGTWGTLGAAIAAASLGGASAKEFASILNVAAPLGVANSDHAMFEGATVRNTYAGLAVRNGMSAWSLVRSGFSGEHDGLGSVFGKVVSDSWQPSSLTDELGHRFEISRNYFKLHACCRWNHAALDVLAELRASHQFHAPLIDRIDVDTYAAAARLTDTKPRNTLAARFSLPFAVATALVNDDTGWQSFSWPALQNPAVTELATRVQVREDTQMTAMLPECRPARVTVWLRDGSCFEGYCETNRGDAEVPYSATDLEAKFTDLGQRVWPTATTRSLHRDLMALEDIDDMNDLDINDSTGLPTRTDRARD